MSLSSPPPSLPRPLTTTIPVRLSFLPNRDDPSQWTRHYSRDRKTTYTPNFEEVKCFLLEEREGYGKTSRIPYGPYLFSASKIKSSMTVCCKIPTVYIKHFPINSNFSQPNHAHTRLEIKENTTIYLDASLILTALQRSEDLSKKSSFQIVFFVQQNRREPFQPPSAAWSIGFNIVRETRSAFSPTRLLGSHNEEHPIKRSRASNLKANITEALKKKNLSLLSQFFREESDDDPLVVEINNSKMGSSSTSSHSDRGSQGDLHTAM